MKISIKSTGTITTVDGQPMRVWDGVTGEGVKVWAFVRLVTVQEEDAGRILPELLELLGSPGEDFVPVPTVAAGLPDAGTMIREGQGFRPLYAPITDDWLRANGFQLEDNRGDHRLPVRRLAIGWDLVGGPPAFQSHDDLCIDLAPVIKGQWHCWLMQVEPYRHIHVRHMRHTWEVARLYEGLTGKVWPGTL